MPSTLVFSEFSSSECVRKIRKVNKIQKRLMYVPERRGEGTEREIGAGPGTDRQRQVACHRSVAYVYRQKFRPVRGDTDRSQEVSCTATGAWIDITYLLSYVDPAYRFQMPELLGRICRILRSSSIFEEREEEWNVMECMRSSPHWLICLRRSHDPASLKMAPSSLLRRGRHLFFF